MDVGLSSGRAGSASVGRSRRAVVGAAGRPGRGRRCPAGGAGGGWGGGGGRWAVRGDAGLGVGVASLRMRGLVASARYSPVCCCSCRTGGTLADRVVCGLKRLLACSAPPLL